MLRLLYGTRRQPSSSRRQRARQAITVLPAFPPGATRSLRRPAVSSASSKAAISWCPTSRRRLTLTLGAANEIVQVAAEALAVQADCATLGIRDLQPWRNECWGWLK